jgi:hypothetical protein
MKMSSQRLKKQKKQLQYDQINNNIKHMMRRKKLKRLRRKAVARDKIMKRILIILLLMIQKRKKKEEEEVVVVVIVRNVVQKLIRISMKLNKKQSKYLVSTLTSSVYSIVIKKVAVMMI